MKFQIQQSDLITPLQSVARSCGVRSSLPVLANILIQTDQGKIKLSATNLEIGVIEKVTADILEEGEITVPAKMLVDVVSSLSGEIIDFEGSSDQLKISTKSFNATINGISASEFPSIPLASDQSVLIASNLLLYSLPSITFAAAVDEGRPVLTGILTEIKGNSLEMVATDGFRLAHKTAQLDSDKADFKALIPRRTFEEVVRLISEQKNNDSLEHIEVSTSENQNQMIFKIGDTQLSSRLIEGQFPNWEKIIPSSFENKTIIDRAEFLKAVKLASVFAKDAANIIKIETGEGKLKLSSEARDLGIQSNEVIANSEGANLIIAFNGKFLQDALTACSSKQVSINFSGSLSPALIKPVGEEGLEYVIMPIRLS